MMKGINLPKARHERMDGEFSELGEDVDRSGEV